MLREAREVSFADPHSEFYLPRFPHYVDGHHPGEPTGEVVCICCWRSDMNIDEIDHEETCPQRHVHSRFWRDTHGG